MYSASVTEQDVVHGASEHPRQACATAAESAGWFLLTIFQNTQQLSECVFPAWVALPAINLCKMKRNLLENPNSSRWTSAYIYVLSKWSLCGKCTWAHKSTDKMCLRSKLWRILLQKQSPCNWISITSATQAGIYINPHPDQTAPIDCLNIPYFSI